MGQKNPEKGHIRPTRANGKALGGQTKCTRYGMLGFICRCQKGMRALTLRRFTKVQATGIATMLLNQMGLPLLQGATQFAPSVVNSQKPFAYPLTLNPTCGAGGLKFLIPSNNKGEITTSRKSELGAMVFLSNQ